MSAQPPLQHRAHGFGLVEIMVGIAIGLIGVLVMMQVSVIFEAQKRTTTSGSDAQTNGAVALYTIERDIRRAGYGMNVVGALGCRVKRSYQTSESTPDLILTPITITDGANGLPDRIQILASSKGGWSVPNIITTNHPHQATNIFLNTSLGIEINDMMVLYEAGKENCTLIQATGIPNGNVQVHHQGGNNSDWNPPSGGTIYPTGGFGVGGTAINLGAIIDHTYLLARDGTAALNAFGNGTLVLNDYSSSTNSTTPQPLASDIVQLQMQYGFDTVALNDGIVTRWSDTLINDLARIYAVRIAVVARSSLKGKPNSNGVCDTTIDTATTSPVRAANVPTWTAGHPTTGQLQSTVIDVSKNPDGTANPDWKCYRYKVFESVVPLRNMLWRDA
jgi:type IV pilus assembly protein PilW